MRKQLKPTRLLNLMGAENIFLTTVTIGEAGCPGIVIYP